MTPSPETREGRSTLLLGATGLVGSHCLDLLLADEAYATVRVLARRPPRQRHAKLDYHEVDFDRLAAAAALFRVDDLFCALGTTIAKAGSRDAFQTLPLPFALMAHPSLWLTAHKGGCFTLTAQRSRFLIRSLPEVSLARCS